MILLTAFDEGYCEPFGNRFINSLHTYAKFPFKRIVPGGKHPEDLDYFEIPADPTGMPKGMFQHGAFLPHINYDGVILFTDADMSMQRELSLDELELLSNIKDGEVAAGINRFPGETLADEYPRLGPTLTVEGIYGGAFRSAHCYNTGFVAATRSTWEAIYRKFMELWPEVNRMFTNPAKVQFGICLAVSILNLKVVDLPLSLVSHGHSGWAPGVVVEDGVAKFDGQVIAFEHRLTL